MATSAAKLKTAPAPEAAAAPASPARGGRGKLILIVLLVLLGAGGGAGGWYWWSSRAAAEDAETAPDARKSPPQFVALDQFTVNLRDEGIEHYLQVAIVLQVTNGAAAESVKLYMPIIRNRILLLLSSKRAQELTSVEGKQKLALEIAAETREPLPPGRGGDENKGVENVQFASFVIQ